MHETALRHVLAGVVLVNACSFPPDAKDDGSAGSGFEIGACPPASTSAPPSVVHASPTTANLRTIATSIPAIDRQGTPRGRSIAQLHPHHDRLYVAYGDYMFNTGPLTVVALDVQTERFELEAVLQTEEILNFRSFGASLWVADADPRGDATSGSVFIKDDPCAPWRDGTDVPGAVHVFDARRFGEEIVIATGSMTDMPAFVMATQDARTWRVLHELQPPPGHFARFNHLHVSPAGLTVTGGTHGPRGRRFAHHFDGGQWRDLESVPQTGFSIPIVQGDPRWFGVFDLDPGKGATHLSSHALVDSSFELRRWLPDGLRLVNWYEHLDPAELWVLARDELGNDHLLARPLPWTGDWTLQLPLAGRADWPVHGGKATAIARVATRIYLSGSGPSLQTIDGLWP